MKRSYYELVKEIRDVVREKAQEIPKFRESGNGAIRILAYPLCREADEWLGGLSTFGSDPASKDDIVDYEYTFAITSGGRRVITGKWDDDTELQTVDCYAYSALKIAYCSRVQDEGAGLSSGVDLKIPHLTEDYGYAAHPGAICAEILQRKGDLAIDDSSEPSTPVERDPFCLIYVCVSGADSEDDEKCAMSSIGTICEFFANETAPSSYKQFMVRVPSASSKIEEREPGVTMLYEEDFAKALALCYGEDVYRLHFMRSYVTNRDEIHISTLEFNVKARKGESS